LPADPALGAEFTGYSPFLGILMTYAWLLVRLGRLDESTAVCDRAESLAREHGDIEVRTWMQLPRIEVDVLRGDVSAARGRAQAALETGAKATTPQSLWVGPFLMGIVHRLESAWDDSIARLEEALGRAMSGGNRMFEGWVRAEIALALLGRDQLDLAEEEAYAAVEVAHAKHCRPDEVRAHLALARTQLRRADGAALARAEQALVRAQELIEEVGARAFQPEVHECRARLARVRGDARAADSEVEEVRRLYAAMGAPAQVDRLSKEIR
jgi:hypothetical protein